MQNIKKKIEQKGLNKQGVFRTGGDINKIDKILKSLVYWHGRCYPLVTANSETSQLQGMTFHEENQDIYYWTSIAICGLCRHTTSARDTANDYSSDI